MRLIVAVCVISLLAHGGHAVQWKSCGDATEFVPKEVKLNPDPPTIGSEVKFLIAGTADREVTGGLLDVMVKYKDINFPDGMGSVQQGGQQLPHRAGPITIHYSQTLPPVTPPGPYVVELHVSDDEGKELMCLEVDFDILPPGAQLFKQANQGAVGLGMRRGMTFQCGRVLAPLVLERILGSCRTMFAGF